MCCLTSTCRLHNLKRGSERKCMETYTSENTEVLVHPMPRLETWYTCLGTRVAADSSFECTLRNRNIFFGYRGWRQFLHGKGNKDGIVHFTIDSLHRKQRAFVRKGRWYLSPSPCWCQGCSCFKAWRGVALVSWVLSCLNPSYKAWMERGPHPSGRPSFLLYPCCFRDGFHVQRIVHFSTSPGSFPSFVGHALRPRVCFIRGWRGGWIHV